MVNSGIDRFFVKIFAIIISVSLIIGIINSFYIKGFYYQDTYGEIEAMKDVPNDLQIVNLGTSHGLASFRYTDDCNLKGYNLALSGEDIYHDFQTLKQFSSHLSKGCIVALVTSYFSFCMSTEIPSQKRYYLYLDKDKIRDFNYETLISAKYVPVLRSGENIIKDLVKDQEVDIGAQMMKDKDSVVQTTVNVQDNNTEIQTIEKANSNERQEKIESLNSHANGRVESWRSGYMTNGRRYIDDNTKILKEMVEYCYDNGFKPVLVSTPIFHSLNELFSKDELDMCYFNNLNKVAEETGTPYFDFSHDEELSYEPFYYDNSDHLNSDGASAFWIKCFARLTEIGYVEKEN